MKTEVSNSCMLFLSIIMDISSYTRTKLIIIPAMGIMTLSDSVFIILKILEFHVLGDFPTSVAIVPTLSLTSVNMVSKLVSTHP